MPTSDRNTTQQISKIITKTRRNFDGTLGTWKTDQVDFKLKYDAKPVCSRPYPVPKVHEVMFKN